MINQETDKVAIKEWVILFICLSTILYLIYNYPFYAIILLVLASTNPPKESLYTKFKLKKDMPLASLFLGRKTVDRTLQSMLKINNYVIFSTVSVLGSKEISLIGVLGYWF